MNQHPKSVWNRIWYIVNVIGTLVIISKIIIIILLQVQSFHIE